ncbi:hypothetical protein HPB47_012861 [Ixodes persulcatus]|uniref:Uncharacterized protein n=1 Tax=Ixodes persulcatus TaxID=34615 RepID=A0AC60NSG8_IXOPE|nr:hypothetical protein HPB47_012861 [Ixodes persulcatus]
MAFFGISLRKRHVDPGLFGHLSATRIPWSCKKKIIKAYRDATSARVLELNRASADMAFFGISLRKRHVDPGLFGHLSATRIPWSCKKKIIKAYRDATRHRFGFGRFYSERVTGTTRGFDCGTQEEDSI